MKNKYFLPILSCPIIFILFIYLTNLYHCADTWHGFIIADWLVNFQAGFVRRGLSGFLILSLSDFLNVQPNFMVMFIQLFFYLAYMSILFFLVKKKQINIWFILLLLSPATLFFPILDVCGVGRKEIILFFLFGSYLICLNKKMLRSDFLILITSIVLLVATLFHELVFFYTPYFIFAAYIKSKTDNEHFNLPKHSLVMLGSLLVIIPLFLFGKSINGAVICEGLIARGMDPNICSGMLSGPIEFDLSYAYVHAKESNYFGSYGTALLLGLLPFILFVNDYKSKILTLKKFLLAFLFLFLFSLPVFALAFDWGRWINIHLILLLFTSTLLLKDQAQGWQDEKLVIPRLWKSEKATLKLSNNLLFLSIFFFYLVSWHMRHFGAFSVFYVDQLNVLREEFSKSLTIVNDLAL
jgi:hypothetical protein